jgi:O-antigen ligase
MSLIESVLWRQKQTLVSANFEDTRIDSFFNIIELIKNEELGFVGYSYNDYLRRFDYFLHNTFLDILLFNGLYLGLIFLFSIVLNVFKFYSNVKNGFLYNWIFHICLVSLISFFFLSMYQQKLFWFVIVLLFYYSRKNIANFNYLQNG